MLVKQVGELMNANRASSVRIQNDGTTEEAVGRVCRGVQGQHLQPSC